MTNEKGLTLAQMVLLIVVVLIVLVVMVPQILHYITDSETGSFISSAQFYVDEVRKHLTLTQGFPVDQDDSVPFRILDLDLDKKKQKSVYGNNWVSEKSYVISKNIGTMEDPVYSYSITLQDEEGYCLELTDETVLKRASVKRNECNIINFDDIH